jgi:transposase
LERRNRTPGGRAAPTPRPSPRKSIIDPFEPILKELLEKYPHLTTERAVQELQARGFTGKYTVVHRRLRLLRPRATPARVPRFETEPGVQAQMDYGVYDIEFTREGRRRVYLFSYLLGYSRRQYLHFVESMDLPTTVREHVHAFHHLGGVARVCLYDNFKAVVLCHDADGAFYNPKFLAFATHYGFRPQACRVRRPQTKGKVERHFAYVESSLLNGRTFDTLAHLNEVTAWWLQTIADERVLRDFQESPRQRHHREQPHLLRCQAATSTPPRSSIAMSASMATSRIEAIFTRCPSRTSARCCRCASPKAKSSSTRSAWRKSRGIRSCPAPRPACGN